MATPIYIDSVRRVKNPEAPDRVDETDTFHPPRDCMASVDTGDLLRGVSTIFASLGRGLVCLNNRFEIVHVSASMDELLGDGAAASMVGQSAEAVFGGSLFGPAGPLRRALESGERREGWGVSASAPGGEARMLSITVAPVLRTPDAPCDPRVSFVAVVRAADDSELAPASSTTIYSGMVARSPVMLQIFQLIERLEESDATVLITGPSGTGKELVARAIHANSTRRNGPFVAVNCGALPGDLLESELFGHVKGAFTGAVRDREGRFEYASGGTIFLDEVGDLPLHLQVKLLRVLQERTYERVGESRPRKADARVIAATNRDMKRAVLDGQFRDDLYYRLRVVPINLPSLHERREDIEPLARFLLARVNRRHDRSVRLAPDAMAALLRYHWPGNVRELENALEYALAVTSGQTIHAQDLPEEALQAEHRHGVPEERGEQAVAPVPVRAPAEERSAAGYPVATGSERGAIASGSEQGAVGTTHKYDAERNRIRSALESHRWNRSQTAEALGLSRSTLWRKMREYGLMG